MVSASLDGVEARLRLIGESQRFFVTDKGGRQLQHQCTTEDARVNFWPGTLQWNVEGPRGAFVESALLLPLGDESEGSEPCDAAMS